MLLQPHKLCCGRVMYIEVEVNLLLYAMGRDKPGFVAVQAAVGQALPVSVQIPYLKDIVMVFMALLPRCFLLDPSG